MKKIILTIVAAIALTLTSCNKEDIQPIVNNPIVNDTIPTTDTIQDTIIAEVIDTTFRITIGWNWPNGTNFGSLFGNSNMIINENTSSFYSTNTIDLIKSNIKLNKNDTIKLTTNITSAGGQAGYLDYYVYISIAMRTSDKPNANGSGYVPIDTKVFHNTDNILSNYYYEYIKTF